MALEYKICPTILAADFMQMGAVIRELHSAGMQHLHLDVMDGHYVPDITYGRRFAEDARAIFDGEISAHLMVTNPLDQAGQMLQAGVDTVIFQAESSIKEPVELFSDGLIREVVSVVRSNGRCVGLAINALEDMSQLADYLDNVDLVLVATGPIGAVGKSFDEARLSKVRWVRERYPDMDIMVDVGVGGSNIQQTKDAGANLYAVSRSIITNPKGAAQAFADLQKMVVS